MPALQVFAVVSVAMSLSAAPVASAVCHTAPPSQHALQRTGSRLLIGLLLAQLPLLPVTPLAQAQNTAPAAPQALPIPAQAAPALLPSTPAANSAPQALNRPAADQPITTPVPPTLAAKAWLLLENGSGQVLTSQNAEQRIEPASLTKIMTAYITFTALRQKLIQLNQAVPVSEKAWKMEGSKMFIKVGDQVPVDELIKGMIVQSGNDACITLAEAIAGSEESFVQLMNREAKRLGMKDTSFQNVTGLPHPQHLTSARDLSILATTLIRDFPEEYARYYSMKEFRYNNITQPNRNRLLFIDPSVDGMKTGHTDNAGFCLVSSAKRENGRRLIAVVTGTDSDNARAAESHKLLNWGFQSYESPILFAKGKPVAEVKVWKGSESSVQAGFFGDFSVAVPRGFADRLNTEFIPQAKVMAPVAQGQVLGSLKVTLDGKPYGEFPVYAWKPVAEAGFFGRLIDSIRLWFA